MRNRAACVRASLEPLEERTLLSVAPAPLWLVDAPTEARAQFDAGRTTIEWLSRSDDQAVGRLCLPGVLVDQVLTHDAWFTTLEVPGWTCRGQLGRAALPSFQGVLKIPSGAAAVADCTVEETAVFDVDNPVIPVQPVAAPSADSVEPEDGEFTLDCDYYAGKRDVETRILTVSEPMVARGTTLVSLGLHPFCYDPVSNRVTVATTISFSLSFVESAELDKAGQSESGPVSVATACDCGLSTWPPRGTPGATRGGIDR